MKEEMNLLPEPMQNPAMSQLIKTMILGFTGGRVSPARSKQPMFPPGSKWKAQESTSPPKSSAPPPHFPAPPIPTASQADPTEPDYDNVEFTAGANSSPGQEAAALCYGQRDLLADRPYLQHQPQPQPPTKHTRKVECDLSHARAMISAPSSPKASHGRCEFWVCIPTSF